MRRTVSQKTNCPDRPRGSPHVRIGVRVKRWGKSPPRRQQCRRHEKPSRVQGKIGDGVARSFVPGMSHANPLRRKRGTRLVRGAEKWTSRDGRKAGAHRIRLTASEATSFPSPVAQSAGRSRRSGTRSRLAPWVLWSGSPVVLWSRGPAAPCSSRPTVRSSSGPRSGGPVVP